ncbi:hypothetical protein GJ496_004635 [Pomphorhynchus laevis]|nr:hypothetical protein GJ496_004635 [Pomphorhynchus laevis]
MVEQVSGDHIIINGTIKKVGHLVKNWRPSKRFKNKDNFCGFYNSWSESVCNDKSKDTNSSSVIKNSDILCSELLEQLQTSTDDASFENHLNILIEEENLTRHTISELISRQNECKAVRHFSNSYVSSNEERIYNMLILGNQLAYPSNKRISKVGNNAMNKICAESYEVVENKNIRSDSFVESF